MDFETLLKVNRKAFRFPSTRGDLTFEDLWGIPLQSKSGFSLDEIAKTLHAESQKNEGVSFVTQSASPEAAHASERLEVVKYVIGVRIAENTAKLEREAKAQQKRKLLDLLADKEAQALQTMSADEIKAKIAELDV
jgi:DNA-binding transcriptional MerR regulator